MVQRLSYVLIVICSSYIVTVEKKLLLLSSLILDLKQPISCLVFSVLLFVLLFRIFLSFVVDIDVKEVDYNVRGKRSVMVYYLHELD